MNQNILKLYDQIKDYDYVIVEGFDKVGKSTVINDLVRLSNGKFKSWKVDYHSDFSDLRFLPYNSRYLLGVSLTNALLQEVVKLTQPIIVDRGVISGFVYQQLYNQETTQHFYWYKDQYVNIFNKLNIIVIYVVPKSKEDSQKFYKIPRSNEESYDCFDSFFSYHQNLIRADQLFRGYLAPINHIIYYNQFQEEK